MPAARPDLLIRPNLGLLGPTESELPTAAVEGLLPVSGSHQAANSAQAAGNATQLSSTVALNENSTVWQGLAVGCLDWNHGTTTFEENMNRRNLANATAPHTQGASQSYMYNTQCIGWPVPVKNPQHALNQTAMRLAPPILMVNAYHDPSTSYTWAIGGREQIENAVLLSRDGDSHTSYGLAGEASHIMDEYLLTLKVPKENTVVMT